jgi:hypothetical protein
VTAGILAVTTVEKFTEGGFMTILITGVVIAFCILNRGHYNKIRRKLRDADGGLPMEYPLPMSQRPALVPNDPTAVFVVGSNRWGRIYALEWVRREFPEHFRNFVFMSARTVDAKCFSGDEELNQERKRAEETLGYFVAYCNNRDLAAQTYVEFGTDPIEELTGLAEKVRERFPHSMFFTSKLIFEHDNWYIRQLHSEAALTMLRRLHLRDMPMVVLPMRL